MGLLDRLASDFSRPADEPRTQDVPEARPKVVVLERIGVTELGTVCSPVDSKMRYRVEHNGDMWEIYDGSESVGQCRRQLDALRIVQQAIARRSVPVTQVFAGGGLA